MSLRVESIFTLLPRGVISGAMSLEGPLLRTLADHPTGHSVIRQFSHGGLGRLAIRLARAGRLLEGRQPVELSLSVMRYFFEPILEVVTESEEEAVFCLTRCPYGWRDEKDAPLCDAVMQLERELVDGMGGTLIIEETIPQGAPKCRFTLRADTSRPG